MNISNLALGDKKRLYEEAMVYIKQIGNIDYFITILEHIRAQKLNVLLNETLTCNYEDIQIRWNKAIYKNTLSLLFNSMRKEEKDGDLLQGLNSKEYKLVMNMMRTLRPVKFSIIKKESQNSTVDILFDILDTSENKKTKITSIFKMIFFYDIDFVKDVLNYKVKR